MHLDYFLDLEINWWHPQASWGPSILPTTPPRPPPPLPLFSPLPPLRKHRCPNGLVLTTLNHVTLDRRKGVGKYDAVWFGASFELQGEVLASGWENGDWPGHHCRYDEQVRQIRWNQDSITHNIIWLLINPFGCTLKWIRFPISRYSFQKIDTISQSVSKKWKPFPKSRSRFQNNGDRWSGL